MTAHPCACGCGRPCTVSDHYATEACQRRWMSRDVVPLPIGGPHLGYSGTDISAAIAATLAHFALTTATEIARPPAQSNAAPSGPVSEGDGLGGNGLTALRRFFNTLRRERT